MNKIFIKTYGCSFNQLDSQIIKGKLKKDKYEIVNFEELADLIIINSCSVKNLSENKFWNDLKKLKEKKKKLIVSGCVTQAEESYLNSKLKGISVMGTNDIDKISFIVENTLNDNPIQILSKLKRKKENEEIRLEKEKLRLENEKLSDNPIIEIIPINEGCLNTCSFCKTKQARGHLFSYKIESIKIAFEKAIKNNKKEIYLTSQDTGCYGFDIGTNLPSLLKELLKIKGDYKIRIGMGNPNHYKKIIDEILEIMLEDSRVYKFLHIPLQSGSDRILTEMNRMYLLNDYEQIMLKAKLKIPNITIANDIIVAYPTETIEDFNDTLKSLKWTNVLNFSRFWLRPNTPAQTLYNKKDFIDGLESKRRIRLLKEKFMENALINNSKWINWEGEIILCEIGKDGTNTIIGRNDYYKPIIIKNYDNKLKIGDKIKVRINKVTSYDFSAELI